MTFKQGHPIIIGLCGEAGTGKTVTAQTLVPQNVVRQTATQWWDHKFLAMPLYEMASIRRDISGIDTLDRMRHELHMVLHDLFGKSMLYGLPDYDTLVELVYDVSTTPIDMNLDKKPRTFLQTVGSMCRELDEDVFVKWLIRAIKRDAAWATEQGKQYIGIVSDVRMPNEAKAISEQPNGLVIKLAASPEVRDHRLMHRDGNLLTPEQSQHVSERIDLIPPEYIAYTLDTDNLSVKEQAKTVLNITNEVLQTPLQLETSNGEKYATA